MQCLLLGEKVCVVTAGVQQQRFDCVSLQQYTTVTYSPTRKIMRRNYDNEHCTTGIFIRTLSTYGSHLCAIVRLHMLWFSFILGLNFIFLCFKLIIIYYHTQGYAKRK